MNALTPLQRIRLRVFRDLWEKGYFVAFGSKFSADFLIYEDDPSRTHATALVIVKEYGAAFACVDIVSHCRVAKMVKKQVFFASQHPDKDIDDVVYIAVNHALLATRQEL
uniref:tRNA-intron lyase n=1 Tax=Globisporangium ultimum (strain ATCC 200006 / CBS 805.95 / DAOM BR144) TaxID=431595 RepID=K3WV19_GLOUD